MSFSLDMKKFTEKAGKNADVVVRKTAIDLFSAVMRSTPVDSGRARGAWMFSINKFSDTTPINIRSDSEVQNEIIVGTSSYKAGDTLTLSNNVNYIERLEYGRSKQSPPHAMVRLNILKFQTFINNATRTLK